MPSECLFCGIASHEVPADIVHEDDLVVAFRDIAPAAPTHLLVIPIEHVASAAELDPGKSELMVRLIDVANRMARDTGIAETGYRLVTNIGDDARQSVRHLHIHLLGGRRLGWPPG